MLIYMKKRIGNHTTGVLLEHIDSKLDLVIEGHRGLEKKIDVHYKELVEFKNETNYKFEIVLDELHIIKNEPKEKVCRDEFIVLEKRVAYLEKARK